MGHWLSVCLEAPDSDTGETEHDLPSYFISSHILLLFISNISSIICFITGVFSCLFVFCLQKYNLLYNYCILYLLITPFYDVLNDFVFILSTILHLGLDVHKMYVNYII